MKNQQNIKKHKISIRKNRVRAKISGHGERPRLSVYRSLKHIYGQLIDDQKKVTLISASDLEKLKKFKAKENKDLKGKVKVAYQVGLVLAEKALAKGFKKVVFDRGSAKYTGRVKALAEGAREGGLIF